MGVCAGPAGVYKSREGLLRFYVSTLLMIDTWDVDVGAPAMVEVRAVSQVIRSSLPDAAALKSLEYVLLVENGSMWSRKAYNGVLIRQQSLLEGVKSQCHPISL